MRKCTAPSPFCECPKCFHAKHGSEAVVSSAIVRLVAPLAGQYCSFDAGELVKVKPSTRAGTLTVERATWRNSLTISNVLAYVPSHLVCTEPNDKALAQTGRKETL